jgi:hypothetical protein
VSNEQLLLEDSYASSHHFAVCHLILSCTVSLTTSS